MSLNSANNFYVKPLIIKSNNHFFLLFIIKEVHLVHPSIDCAEEIFCSTDEATEETEPSSVESCSTVKCFFSSVLIVIVSKSSSNHASCRWNCCSCKRPYRHSEEWIVTYFYRIARVLFLFLLPQSVFFLFLCRD